MQYSNELLFQSIILFNSDWIISWNSFHDYSVSVSELSEDEGLINRNHFQKTVITFTQKRFNFNDDDKGKCNCFRESGKMRC